MTVNGRLIGEIANIKGSVSVNGNLEAENFILNGLFDIKGMLNADIAEIGLRYGSSKALEIIGEKITVKRKSTIIPFQKNNGSLQVQVIEGNEIYLEYTTADLVRGHSVRIGPGCEIRKVEYHDHFSCSSNSSVKEHTKI
jgi:cytoskeletal protein CcmA (bactofilin family)